jgi:hypothetical protein
MKKILFFFNSRHAGNAGFAACRMAILLSLSCLSCSDIYDNVKEFSEKETVYPAHFETVYGAVGYERVEIDLSRNRIPSSEMNLGKAKKTIVEYDSKTLTYDSVCSWLNITGLTEPKLHRFKIFTEDEHGNRSTPTEIALTPYTEYDKNALSLPTPVYLESTTVGLVEWKNPISNDSYDLLEYSYSYVNMFGDSITGSSKGDLPSFFIEDVTWGELLTVTITCKIIPKVDRQPILDTILWSYPMTFAVEGSLKAIFLDQPALDTPLNIVTSFPYVFSWKKAEGLTDYTVLISDQSSFFANETTAIRVGDVDSYALKAEDLTESLQRSFFVNAPVYWTVVPTDRDPSVVTQSRKFNVQRKLKKSYMQRFTSSGERWTTHIYDAETNVYRIQSNGNNDTQYTDNYLYTEGLTEAIPEKALMFAYDYQLSNSNSTTMLDYIINGVDFEYFVCTPNAAGGKSIVERIQLTHDALSHTDEFSAPIMPPDDNWHSHAIEFGQYANVWSWGSVTHRFRFDIGGYRGLVTYIRNIRIDAYE